MDVLGRLVVVVPVVVVVVVVVVVWWWWVVVVVVDVFGRLSVVVPVVVVVVTIQKTKLLLTSPPNTQTSNIPYHTIPCYTIPVSYHTVPCHTTPTKHFTSQVILPAKHILLNTVLIYSIMNRMTEMVTLLSALAWGNI